MNTLNELTSELEKPYKAEQDAAREQMLAEIAAVLKPPEPPADAFTSQDMADYWGITNDAAANRLKRDRRVERLGMFANRMYYRIKDD